MVGPIGYELDMDTQRITLRYTICAIDGGYDGPIHI